jgi:hypothetical protein
VTLTPPPWYATNLHNRGFGYGGTKTLNGTATVSVNRNATGSVVESLVPAARVYQYGSTTSELSFAALDLDTAGGGVSLVAGATGALRIYATGDVTLGAGALVSTRGASSVTGTGVATRGGGAGGLGGGTVAGGGVPTTGAVLTRVEAVTAGLGSGANGGLGVSSGGVNAKGGGGLQITCGRLTIADASGIVLDARGRPGADALVPGVGGGGGGGGTILIDVEDLVVGGVVATSAAHARQLLAAVSSWAGGAGGLGSGAADGTAGGAGTLQVLWRGIAA